MSKPRISYDAFARIAPIAQNSLITMGRQADESGIDKTIIELVKLRVSQINNCAFCLQIHLNVSRKLGVPQEKLDLVATWEEAGIFSDKEGAALAWAETLANLAGHSVSDAAYAAVREHFSEEEVVFLSVSIATINAWNRLGVAFRFAPPIPKKGAAAA
ncbi:carboxymuconolactone decarboxylase family protein [Reyranella sp.]|uniref:carboxymuconolactone decarboxylase family protein n=1 Tax=Reyranella sp. TaxID=1929291 RepID=UPI003D0A7FEB